MVSLKVVSQRKASNRHNKASSNNHSANRLRRITDTSRREASRFSSKMLRNSMMICLGNK